MDFGDNGFDEMTAVRNAKMFLRREQASSTVRRETNTDFKNFKSSFLDNLGLLRQQLLSVYTPIPLNLDTLYDISGNIFSSMDHTVDAFLYLNAIYSSEYYIIEHCLRVGLLAHIFAKWLNLDADMERDATLAGFLHDIGMLQIPKELIEKEGGLTDDEYRTMREHAARGALMLMNKGVSDNILEAIRSHHERYDGSGYPTGKKGEQIGQLTAMISIVDTFDSMTSHRPYSVAKCPFDVIEIFETEMFCRFNPGLLYVFLDNIAYMYKNVLVRLTNGEEAKVVFINKHHKTLPIVQLERTGEYVDLSMERGVKIQSLL